MTVVATPTDLLKVLSSAQHPYYQSSQHEETHENMASFLNEWKQYDIDYNRVVRWDIRSVNNDFSKAEDMEPSDIDYYGPWGTQYVELAFVAPRKGHTFTQRILNIRPSDMPALYAFLKKQWNYTQEMWNPLPTLEYSPPVTPQSRFLDKVQAVVETHTLASHTEPTHVNNLVNDKVHCAVRDVLGVIDDSYVLLERPEDDTTPLDPGLDIAGELATTYFAQINN